MKAGDEINPIPLLRDIDQPYTFSVNMSSERYRFEFYDTSSPENWRLLDPDVIIMCYDISQRLSLINMKRYVSTASFLFIFCLIYFIFMHPESMEYLQMLYLPLVDQRGQTVVFAQRFLAGGDNGAEERLAV